MGIPALDAARALRRAIAFDASYVRFTLNRKRPNNTDVQEFFDRLKRCRMCILRLHQVAKRRQDIEPRSMARARAAQAAGQHKRHRFHIRQMNKHLKRTGHESLLFIEAFYWNAARVADAAESLGLLHNREKFDGLDAFRVRNKLIEHRQTQRPSMSAGLDPVYKPDAPLPLQVRSVHAHALQLASMMIEKMDAQMQENPGQQI